MKNNQNNKQALSVEDFLSTMSKADLKNLGIGNIAYVKRYVINSQTAFVLHAADGATLTVQNNESAARQSAHYQDLDLATLH